MAGYSMKPISITLHANDLEMRRGLGKAQPALTLSTIDGPTLIELGAWLRQLTPSEQLLLRVLASGIVELMRERS